MPPKELQNSEERKNPLQNAQVHTMGHDLARLKGSKNDQKNQGLESLFARSEQQFQQGELDSAEKGFQKVQEEYIPEGGILNKFKRSKPLNEKASEYIEEIRDSKNSVPAKGKEIETEASEQKKMPTTRRSEASASDDKLPKSSGKAHTIEDVPEDSGKSVEGASSVDDVDASSTDKYKEDVPRELKNDATVKEEQSRSAAEPLLKRKATDNAADAPSSDSSNEKELERLFEEGKKDFRAGAYVSAKNNFNIVKDEYRGEGKKGFGGLTRSEPLNVQAEEYLKKIDEMEGQNEEGDTPPPVPSKASSSDNNLGMKEQSEVNRKHLQAIYDKAKDDLRAGNLDKAEAGAKQIIENENVADVILSGAPASSQANVLLKSIKQERDRVEEGELEKARERARKETVEQHKEKEYREAVETKNEEVPEKTVARKEPVPQSSDGEDDVESLRNRAQEEYRKRFTKKEEGSFSDEGSDREDTSENNKEEPSVKEKEVFPIDTEEQEDTKDDGFNKDKLAPSDKKEIPQPDTEKQDSGKEASSESDTKKKDSSVPMKYPAKETKEVSDEDAAEPQSRPSEEQDDEKRPVLPMSYPVKDVSPDRGGGTMTQTVQQVKSSAMMHPAVEGEEESEVKEKDVSDKKKLPEQNKEEVVGDTKEEIAEQDDDADQRNRFSSGVLHRPKEDAQEQGPPPMTREIVREYVRSPTKEEIQGVLDEKERLKEAGPSVYGKVDNPDAFKEYHEKKLSLEKEKAELDKEEIERTDESDITDIKKKKEGVERERKKLLSQDIPEEWKRRMEELESKLKEVNEKYEKEGHKSDEEKEEKPKKRNVQRTYSSMTSVNKDGSVQNHNEEEASKVRGKERLEKMRPTVLKGRETQYVTNPPEVSKKKKARWKIFSGPDITVGIDISDYSVEVFSLNEDLEVIAFNRTVLPEGAVKNGKIAEPDIVQKVLHKTLYDAKPKSLDPRSNTIKAVLGIPESQVFLHQFILADQSVLESDLESLISDNIPIDAEGAYLDHYDLPGSGDGKRRMMVAAIEKEAAQQYISMLEGLGVDPVAFDVESAALGRSLLLAPRKDQVNRKESNEMIVDIGAWTTTLSVFHNGVLALSAIVHLGGMHFTDTIARHFGISRSQAEEKKRNEGLEGAMYSLYSDRLHDLANEIQDAAKYYKREFTSSIDKVILIGGSATIPGLDRYLNDKVEMEVEVGKPLQRLPVNEVLSNSNPVLYGSAIGLALRGVERDPVNSGINLLPDEIKRKEKVSREEGSRLIRVSAYIIIIVGALLMGYALYTRVVPMVMKMI